MKITCPYSESCMCALVRAVCFCGLVGGWFSIHALSWAQTAAGGAAAASASAIAVKATPAAVVTASAASKEIEPSKLEQHPWQVAAPRLTAEAYFTNLADGAKIETPYVLRFGLSGGWGIAPIASKVKGRSGHHHLLVNRELPLDFKQPLPFNEQYIHFGKGQMETVLNLDPGTYTLRLLLADQGHLPHFVFSKPIKVTVTAKKKDVDPKSLVKKGLALYLDSTEAKPPFRVQFHAAGLNVAYANQKLADTGHFRLHVMPKSGGKAAVLNFANAQTEVWLAPPAGEYTLRLDFVDNTNPDKSLAEAVSTTFKVN
jgi:hypothetical protein